jgi:hypothetical protein
LNLTAKDLCHILTSIIKHILAAIIHLNINFPTRHLDSACINSSAEMDAHFISTSALMCHWVPTGSGDLHRACHSLDDIFLIEYLLAFIDFLLGWISVAAVIGIYAIVVITLGILLRLFHRIVSKPIVSKVIAVLKACMACIIFLIIVGVLCSVYGEAPSFLNAPVLRGFRHHWYTGE